MTVDMAEEDDEKPRTLLIGNIPREVHKREIENVFGDIGPLKRCYIQYPRDDKKKRAGGGDAGTLLAYVTYALPTDAVKALETLGNHKLGGNKIHLKFAKTRSEQVRPATDENPRRTRAKGEAYSEKAGNPNLFPIEGEASRDKGPRAKPINKKARLIIRNLSFKVTDENLREYFKPCGEIKDLNILKKSNGKLVGCAFIQFASVPQAAKAMRELNLKPFLERQIAIDWALPKKDFQENGEVKETEAKARDIDTEVKAENEVEVNDDEVMEVEIKPEPVDEPEVAFNSKSAYEHLKIKKDEDDDEEEEKPKWNQNRKRRNELDDDEDDDNEPKRPRNTNDVEEGKTLFIRNLEFGVTEEQLKEFFEEFGPLHYALLCKDRLTEHPKGTGFVKFQDAAAANSCLTEFNVEATKFKLGRRNFSVSPALPRGQVESKQKEDKEKVVHDNRNLYLVREGFIRPGTKGSEGVSAADNNKRAALNSTKKQMLKNLSIFVSPTRLCVHNLPLTFTDNDLVKLFKKYANGGRITEAKIMRDMQNIQLDGRGKSKGFGFVGFKKHENALAALRKVNNNPNIFSPAQRPIVEFSLENRKALQAKEKRKEKSIENNKMIPQPKGKTKTIANEEPEPSSEIPIPSKRKGKKQRKDSLKTAVKKTTTGQKDEASQDLPEFSGLKGQPGVSKIPVVKAKGKITRKSLKGSKPKKLQERRMREPQIKPKKQIDKPDKVEKMVSKYRTQLEGGQKKGKDKKWYA